MLESGAHFTPAGLLSLKRCRVLNYAGVCTIIGASLNLHAIDFLYYMIYIYCIIELRSRTPSHQAHVII
jgi:hypothetical protein